MKGKAVKTACFVVLMTVILPMLFFLEYLTEDEGEKDPTEKTEIMEKDRYNGYGLEGNQQLANTILFETEDVVCYSDRLVTRFHDQPEYSDRLAASVAGVKERSPFIEEVYVLPVPTRIMAEDGFYADKQRYQEYLSLLAEKLAGTAGLVDVTAELKGHEDEYLFFRTAESWTARGAWYGSAALCKALGIEPFPLAAYDEHMYNTFYGDLYRWSRSRFSEESSIAEQIMAMPDDQLFYYLLPDGANREKLFKREGEAVETVTRPTVTPSLSGPSAFIGSSYLWAEVQGDGFNESTARQSLLLVCDDKGKLLAPFLANYYETVVVVNIWSYGELADEIAAIAEKYNIKDFVLAQGVADLGDPGKSKAMNGFINEKEQEAGH